MAATAPMRPLDEQALPKTPGAPPPGGPGGRELGLVGLAGTGLVLTYCLVVLGSTVRVTDSGMGCASWPLCNGHFGLAGGFHALLEQFHRYMASLVTVAVGCTAWAAWRSRSRRAARVPSLVAAGLVLFQAALGALTVFAKNAPWTVGAHLVTGMVFLGTVTVVLHAAIRGGARYELSPRTAGRWATVALGATFLVLVTGTLVVDGGAAHACPSWPLCTQPAPLHLVSFQLVHRSMVALASVAIVGMVLTSWRHMAGRTWWRRGAVALVAQLVVVASMGAASALTRAQAGWQDAHLAMAALLWTLVVSVVAMAGTPAPESGPGALAGSRPPGSVRG